MSVTITKQDLKKVKLFVNLCDKLRLDYKTHHSLLRKANKLLEIEARQQEQEEEQEENSKSVYKTTTDVIDSVTTSLSTWWCSWGTQEATQEEEEAMQEVTEVTEEPCFDEKVGEILVAILEERAEELELCRDTNTVLYDGCEC